MMRMAALLGNPVAHSRSPAMFNAAFAARRVDAVYVPWQLDARDLRHALHTLKAVAALGANVTVPHKQAVLPLLDSVTPLAKRIGAVNCITLAGGRLVGDNTDVYGFAMSLPKRLPKDRPALVLGAGGAARAVIAALEELGVREIVVVSRNQARRRTLARAFPSVSIASWSSLPKHLADAGLVVHATSAQVKHERIELSFSALPKDAVFADLTYGDTPLVRAAKKNRLRAFDGSDMLLLQAARAFTLWTGLPAPLPRMREALSS